MDNIDYQNYEAVADMADSLPIGKERILLREKAVSIADLHGNEYQQYDARMEYMEDVSDDGSFPEKYFTIFPWLLAYVEKNDSGYERQRVLWYYKWVIGIMPEFAAVTRAQMEHALLDLKKRYADFGSTDKVYHDYSRDTYMLLGDSEKSLEHHQLLANFKKRDDLDDCEACVLNRAITFHTRLGTLEEALNVADPILSGKKRCTHVPKDTYSTLLLPLLQKGMTEMAADIAGKLVKVLAKMKYAGNYKNAEDLIIYYTILGEQTKALKLFEKYFPMAWENKEQSGKFFFYVAAIFLLQKISKPTLKLKMPPKAPFYKSDNNYAVSDLLAWLDKETDTLAALFDKRNGNDLYSRKKAQTLAM